MRERPRSPLPWTLVVASLLLVGIVLYLLFSAYLPAKQRIARLESELRDVYAREAQLQTRLAKEEQGKAARDQQLAAYTAERDALARRLEELEKELAAVKAPRRPAPAPRR